MGQNSTAKIVREKKLTANVNQILKLTLGLNFKTLITSKLKKNKLRQNQKKNKLKKSKPLKAMKLKKFKLWQKQKLLDTRHWNIFLIEH